MGFPLTPGYDLELL